jgi:GNAT superfamily N-acetyltransferase
VQPRLRAPPADNRSVNGPRIEIRIASDSDVERVLELWAAARTTYATTEDTPEAVGTLRARDPGSLLVAEREGRVVGTLIAVFDGWRGGMYRLAIDADHRRQGIGTALVRPAKPVCARAARAGSAFSLGSATTSRSLRGRRPATAASQTWAAW